MLPHPSLCLLLHGLQDRFLVLENVFLVGQNALLVLQDRFLVLKDGLLVVECCFCHEWCSFG
jgi:hypothetical protein